MKRIASLLLLLMVSELRAEEKPPPGAMRLLPGYQHVPKQGFDSIPGSIVNPKGLTIDYDIGRVRPAGQPATGGDFSDWAKGGDSNQRLWYQEQTINGQPAHLAYSKDQRLVVSFPQGGINFSVKVQSPEQMAEALLMILSYPPAQAKK